MPPSSMPDGLREEQPWESSHPSLRDSQRANPYASPVGDVAEASTPQVDHQQPPYVVFAIVSVAATLFAFYFPRPELAAIPLVMAPAWYRVTRIRQLRKLRDRPTNDFFLGLTSVIAAVPVAIASGLVLACLLLPAWYVALALRGSPLVGLQRLILMGCLTAGQFAALLVGWRLLRRWHYLSLELIRDRLHQRQLPDDEN